MAGWRERVEAVVLRVLAAERRTSGELAAAVRDAEELQGVDIYGWTAVLGQMRAAGRVRCAREGNETVWRTVAGGRRAA